MSFSSIARSQPDTPDVCDSSVANFDVFLAVCRKFGPVMSNFLVHVQLAAFDQQERTQGPSWSW